VARKRRPEEPSDARGSGKCEGGDEGAVLRARLRGVPLIGDLKQAAADAGWSVNESLRDQDEIPRYALGGQAEGLVSAAQAAPIDFTDLSLRVPANPLLAERRLELGLVHPDVEDVARAIAAGADAHRLEQASRGSETQDRGDA